MFLSEIIKVLSEFYWTATDSLAWSKLINIMAFIINRSYNVMRKKY
jgi:hypothetical protein